MVNIIIGVKEVDEAEAGVTRVSFLIFLVLKNNWHTLMLTDNLLVENGGRVRRVRSRGGGRGYDGKLPELLVFYYSLTYSAMRVPIEVFDTRILHFILDSLGKVAIWCFSSPVGK